MKDESGEVHERILRNTNRAIGIITTASINELEGFTSKRDGFAKWAPNREVIDIGLREEHPEKADDPAVVALIERCDVLFYRWRSKADRGCLSSASEFGGKFSTQFRGL